MFLKVLRTDGGRATFIFSVTAKSYRSLVSVNTPRGADITGVLFLWIVSPSVCFPTTNCTESVFNCQRLLCGRWFGAISPITCVSR
jgi:hypothetical protein